MCRDTMMVCEVDRLRCVLESTRSINGRWRLRRSLTVRRPNRSKSRSLRPTIRVRLRSRRWMITPLTRWRSSFMWAMTNRRTRRSMRCMPLPIARCQSLRTLVSLWTINPISWGCVRSCAAMSIIPVRCWKPSWISVWVSWRMTGICLLLKRSLLRRRFSMILRSVPLGRAFWRRSTKG